MPATMVQFVVHLLIWPPGVATAESSSSLVRYSGRLCKLVAGVVFDASRYGGGIFPFTSDSSRTFRCGGFLILEPLLWMHLCFLSDMIFTAKP